jgi:hypothetical protein
MNNGFRVIDADRHVMEPSDLWDRSVFGDSVTRGFDPVSNLRDMSCEGVDVAVLFPTRFQTVSEPPSVNKRAELDG